jgi:hypothetical protein
VNKEKIYDDEISSLMGQVIAICQREKIAMVASFAIPSPEDPKLLCTSALLEDEYDPPEQFFEAKTVILGGSNFTALIISASPGEGRP